MSGRLLAALALALLIAGCGAGPNPVATADFGEMAADQVMIGVTHNVTTEGVRQAVVRADTALFYEQASEVDFRQVHVVLFETTGREAANLTAASGRVNMRTEAMVARGNVVLITTEAGRRIETEELHYDPQSNRIWSDVPTVLYENGNVIRGDGFEADAELKNITLRRPRGQVQGGRIDF